MVWGIIVEPGVVLDSGCGVVVCTTGLGVVVTWTGGVGVVTKQGRRVRKTSGLQRTNQWEVWKLQEERKLRGETRSLQGEARSLQGETRLLQGETRPLQDIMNNYDRWRRF